MLPTFPENELSMKWVLSVVVVGPAIAPYQQSAVYAAAAWAAAPSAHAARRTTNPFAAAPSAPSAPEPAAAAVATPRSGSATLASLIFTELSRPAACTGAIRGAIRGAVAGAIAGEQAGKQAGVNKRGVAATSATS